MNEHYEHAWLTRLKFARFFFVSCSSDLFSSRSAFFSECEQVVVWFTSLTPTHVGCSTLSNRFLRTWSPPHPTVCKVGSGQYPSSPFRPPSVLQLKAMNKQWFWLHTPSCGGGGRGQALPPASPLPALERLTPSQIMYPGTWFRDTWEGVLY